MDAVRIPVWAKRWKKAVESGMMVIAKVGRRQDGTREERTGKAQDLF